MRFSFLKTMALAALVSSALMQTGLAENFNKADITVQAPWSRATPSSAKVAGGYAVIRNDSATEDHLISVTSPVSDRVELHEMSMDNQVMRMRKLDAPLAIPAKGEVALKPGGYHVMFFDIKKPFKQGEMVPATLHFEKAGDVDVHFTIAAIGAKSLDDKAATSHTPAMEHDMPHTMHHDAK